MEDKPTEDMTWEELANKIDWEGGIEEAFSSYFGADEFIDPQLKSLVAAFQKAGQELRFYLEEKGGVL